MFKINDLIIYENTGACIIKDISIPDFVQTKDIYYFIQPISDQGRTVYVKVGSCNQLMRAVMSSEAGDEILDNVANIEGIYHENDRMREKECKDALRSCEWEQWIAIIKGMSKEQERRALNGKTLNLSDERNLQKVIKFLVSEISVVYQISLEQAKIKLENSLI